jgi:hypothetical protein
MWLCYKAPSLLVRFVESQFNISPDLQKENQFPKTLERVENFPGECMEREEEGYIPCYV